MSPQVIFNLHLVLGYFAWMLCTNAYILPKLKSMSAIDAQRAIATHERIGAAAHTLGFGHVVLARPDAGAVSEAYREL